MNSEEFNKSLYASLETISERLKGLPLANLLVNSLHGTTIGAFKVDDGKAVVAFSDGKVSEGQALEPVSLDFAKVLRLDSHSLFLIAGVASLAMLYYKILETQFSVYEKVIKKPLSTAGKKRRIEDLLMRNMHLAAQGAIVMPLFVTHDKSHGVRIYTLSADGCATIKDYAFGGSGRLAKGAYEEKRVALGIPHGKMVPMSQEEGIAFARNYITTASQIESGSGGTKFIRVLSADGIQDIEGGR